MISRTFDEGSRTHSPAFMLIWTPGGHQHTKPKVNPTQGFPPGVGVRPGRVQLHLLPLVLPTPLASLEILVKSNIDSILGLMMISRLTLGTEVAVGASIDVECNRHLIGTKSSI